MTVTVVDLVSDMYSFVWSGLICDMKGSVSGRDRCDDGMGSGVNDRNGVGVCVGDEGLFSITRNYQFPWQTLR